MSVDPLFCRYCGSVNPSLASFCLHCGRCIAHPRVPGNTLSAPEQKRGIPRRTALLGLAGAVGAIALGSGAGIWYTSMQKKRPQLFTYTGHRGAPITALTWSPDGNSIASGDANGTLLIWDTSTGATVLICRESAAKSVSSVSWSPDGASILAGYSNMLVIWDAQSGKSTLTTAYLTGPAAYSLEGNYKPCYLIYPSLIAACQNQQAVLVFPSASLKTPITSFASGNMSALAFGPEDEHLDLALVTAPPSQKLVVYGATLSSTCAQNGPPNATLSYERVNTLDLANSDVGELSVPWGPGGSYLLGGSLPGKVVITGTWGSYEMDHPAKVVAAALCPAQESLPAGANPDGWYTVIGYIATADAEGVVRVWGNDGKSIVAMQIQQPVLQLAWSPDGNFLAIVHSDGTVQVWQAQLSDLPAIWRDTSFN
jgi:WD40 repeat protein